MIPKIIIQTQFFYCICSCTCLLFGEIEVLLYNNDSFPRQHVLLHHSLFLSKILIYSPILSTHQVIYHSSSLFIAHISFLITFNLSIILLRAFFSYLFCFLPSFLSRSIPYSVSSFLTSFSFLCLYILLFHTSSFNLTHWSPSFTISFNALFSINVFLLSTYYFFLNLYILTTTLQRYFIIFCFANFTSFWIGQRFFIIIVFLYY